MGFPCGAPSNDVLLGVLLLVVHLPCSTATCACNMKKAKSSQSESESQVKVKVE